MTNVELGEIARLMYGADWQRPLAKGLGPLHPDGPRASIDDRLVRRWAAGERPIPKWVDRVIPDCMEEHARQLEERAAAIARAAAALLAS